MTVAIASTRPDIGDRGTIYAIGDIHGCYTLMVDLLDRIVADVDRSAAGTDAALIFLGDYIDRGPATSDVLSGLLWLEAHSPLPAIFLKGNHEQAMLDYVADPVRHHQWLRFGGRSTLRSYGIDLPGTHEEIDHVAVRDRMMDRLPVAHLHFLRRLPLFQETDDFIFVHAGIRPGIDLAQQHERDLLWIREGFLEEQPVSGKRVVHGHTWEADTPEVLAHRIGVDTGAFRTGVLTAAKVRGKAVEFISTADARD